MLIHGPSAGSKPILQNVFNSHISIMSLERCPTTTTAFGYASISQLTAVDRDTTTRLTKG